MTQSEALRVLKTGANVFLTGEPGSGKTHVINEYIAWLRSCGIEPSVTAATGIAATHVGGMTIHSWSGIGIAESLSDADVDRIASKEHVAKRIQKAKVLIIEEISMLSATTFEMADRVCREVRRVDAPFGGLTVILVGDFFQLPPVSRGRESVFAYNSPTWRELHLLVCYLTEQHRQDDKAFLEILSVIRSGRADETQFDALMRRQADDGLLPEDAPRLYSHNADVDRLNAAELAKLPGEVKKFRMSSSGKDSLIDALIRGCLSPEVLELKIGAAVMFTKNSPQGHFVNGTLGLVKAWGEDGVPLVETRGGFLTAAEPMEWQVEEQGKVRASVAQVPLRLAYAMTVHKSQGMSMDAAVVDLSRAFEYGQGYVALSRVRTLSGLHLLGLNTRALEVHPEVLERDYGFREASEAAADTFAGMPIEELHAMQKKFVKAQGGAWVEKSASGVGKRAAKRAGDTMPGRLAETLTAVRDGSNLSQIAKDRGLAVSTIVKHLEELGALQKLSRKDFGHLLPELQDTEEIHEALATSSDERLAPVFSTLGGRFSFETIRLVRLAKNVH